MWDTPFPHRKWRGDGDNHGKNDNHDDDDVSRDFNRVKIEQWRLAPSLIYRKNNNVFFSIKPMIESKQVSYDANRIVAETFDQDNDVFEEQLYAGAEVNYNYYNKDRNTWSLSFH